MSAPPGNGDLGHEAPVSSVPALLCRLLAGWSAGFFCAWGARLLGTPVAARSRCVALLRAELCPDSFTWQTWAVGPWIRPSSSFRSSRQSHRRFRRYHFVLTCWISTRD